MIATESGEFPTETILDDPPSVKNHAENDWNYGHQSQTTKRKKRKIFIHHRLH